MRVGTSSSVHGFLFQAQILKRFSPVCTASVFGENPLARHMWIYFCDLCPCYTVWESVFMLIPCVGYCVGAFSFALFTQVWLSDSESFVPLC